MIAFLTKQLIAVLKLPEQPQPPAGSEGSQHVFRASRKYYAYRLLQWAWKQAAAVVGIFVGLFFFRLTFVEEIASLLPYAEMLTLFEALALGFLFLQMPFTYLMVRLDYDYRWYIVTDRSLRVREGLFSIREQTMTFANIQNLSIRQGPLQRIFGIQDLEVKTAGGGSGKVEESKQAKDLHLASFRGVENAPEIRNKIREHLKTQSNSGLGDPEETEVPALSASFAVSSGTVEAARQLLLEVRRLGASLG